MIRTFRLEKGRIGRFVVFLMVVCALVWYIGLKRTEFLKGPVTKPTAATQAPAMIRPENDYFIDSKVERERSRSQELERLREVMANSLSDAQTRREANMRFLAVSKDSARETEIEHLVKAKGYEDCIAFCGNSGTVVVLRASQVTQVDIAKIAEIVSSVVGARPENLKVVSRQ